LDPIRYIYVFPSKFPSRLTFSEIEESYRRAAARLGSVEVQNLGSWTRKKKEWNDPNTVILFLREIPEVIPPDRKAKCVFHYTESVGEPGCLIPNQQGMADYYSSRAGEFDLFLAGTPSAVEFWRPRCRKVALMPLGYDPEVMGVPNWTREKTHDIGFCGTMIGRRNWVFPSIRKRFGSRYLEIGGISGKERNAAFDACRIMLHVGHSNEKGFAHLRLWSAVSTSAALVTEERDAWPAVPRQHYVSLLPVEEENPETFVDQLVETLKLPLLEIARMMHADLSAYTSDRCLKEFMMPAVEAIL
jgi:hypothetical protein